MKSTSILGFVCVCAVYGCSRHSHAFADMQDILQSYANLTSGGSQGTGEGAYKTTLKQLYLKAKGLDRQDLNRSVPGLGDQFQDKFVDGLKRRIGQGADDPSAPISKSVDGSEARKGSDEIDDFDSWCLSSPIQIKGILRWNEAQKTLELSRSTGPHAEQRRVSP